MSEQQSPVITSYPDAPLPTAQTLRRRQNVVVQLWRFIVNAGNIMMMVLKGHGQH